MTSPDTGHAPRTRFESPARARFASPSLAFTVVVFALAVVTATAADHAPFPREVPEDPPGILSAPRTSPAARPQAGTFTSVQVNVNANGANIVNDAANEATIAVDPTNPNRMAIGWRQFDTIFSNFREAGFAWSSDGGHTWHFPGVLTNGTFRSDPVLGYAANGVFYYSSLTGDLTTDMFVSIDRGVSWSGPYDSYGGDKQWIQVDRTGGLGHGHIYQSWSTAGGCCGTNIFNRSTDGGINFSIPNTIPSTPVWGTMDVTANGTLWLAGVDPGNTSRFIVARSLGAPDPFAAPLFDFTKTVSLGGAIAVAMPDGPNPVGLLGQVWLAIDRSGGPRHGWMYLVCSVDPPGDDPMDVQFTRSTDGGQNWSAPVRINTVQNGWQWFATMSLAPNGRIDVVWNDTSQSGFANLSRLYYSSSSDGGTTWSANVVASPTWDSWQGWPNQEKIGDYYHMISDNVGAHLAWAATFNFEQDVYYLRIGDYDCNGNGVADPQDIALGTSLDLNQNGIPDECGVTTDVTATAPPAFRLFQNVPNPFNPRTSIAFDMPYATTEARLRIHDLQGRLVRTLVAGAVNAGPNAVAWDGLDDRGRAAASGVYVYRLEAPGITASRKMLLLH